MSSASSAPDESTAAVLLAEIACSWVGEGQMSGPTCYERRSSVDIALWGAREGLGGDLGPGDMFIRPAVRRACMDRGPNPPLVAEGQVAPAVARGAGASSSASVICARPLP